jgi:hypothetical protein
MRTLNISISDMDFNKFGLRQKFWGYTENRCTDVTNGAGTVLYQWCCADYYMFWIKFGPECGVGPERLQMY